MAATVSIAEKNGTSGSEVETASITNSNYGSSDTVNMDTTANPITPGNNSYEKWQYWNVTNMGGSAAIKNLKFFSTSPASNTTHKFNGHTTQGTYDSTKRTSAQYATPTASASSFATNSVVTSAPGSANIGIAGSLTGQLTATGVSDFVVSQITTTGSATAGTTLTNTYRYDEIA